MTMSILGGNQKKAERIARDIIKDLTVADVEWTIVEATGYKGEQQLCAAIDDNFLKNERRLSLLGHKIKSAVNDEIGELVDEYDDVRIESSVARQKASFQLGYQAALRLLGVDLKPKAKRRK